MTEVSSHSASVSRLERSDFQALLDALHKAGYTVVGPTVRDAAIVYDELRHVEQLPIGWTDEQEAGTYRLAKRSDQALFGYSVGPQSWKKYFHPPQLTLWQTRRDGRDMTVTQPKAKPPRLALLGARACELAAIRVLDGVLLHSTYVDHHYRVRRESAFIVAVQCTASAPTCFCASMGTGPRAREGFDLALTEVLEGSEHYFIVEAGSKAGANILKGVPHQAGQPADLEAVEQRTADAARQMKRSIDATDVKGLLYAHLEHPRWDDVASRCLTCANCTMVCPTCFCTSVEDVTDLAGQNAERRRRWDSCFNMDFSYIFGGHTRRTPRARYRQWLTHKLATWQDQFGTIGCVGCGRCITWCPVGIDLTEEVRALRGLPAIAAGGG